ncbi:MAG: hypothetical protein KGO00_06160 [Bacteroidetes bacterium]|nr:hypothetical protein [Bacteroidota bacterium]
MENLHIVFWLFKDIAWCLGIPLLGIAMIVPTLAISIIISWRTRQFMSELCHNLAITVWISANSFWMVSEFFHIDETIACFGITYKHLAMFPFGIGVLILAFYYLIWKPRHKNEAETM